MADNLIISHTHSHTHTDIYIYIYMCVCVCVCVCVCGGGSVFVCVGGCVQNLHFKTQSVSAIICKIGIFTSFFYLSFNDKEYCWFFFCIRQIRDVS